MTSPLTREEKSDEKIKAVEKAEAELYLKTCKLCHHSKFISWCMCSCHDKQAKDIVTNSQ